MPLSQDLDDFYLNIEGISVAHEFEYNLTSVYKCPEGRKTYGLVHVLSGKLDYSFYDGRRLTVSAGEMFLLKPKDAYKVSCLEICKHYTVNFLISEPSITGEPLREIFLGNKTFIISNKNSEHNNDNLFRDICAIWYQKTAGYKIRAVSYLYLLLFNLTYAFNPLSNDNKYTPISIAKKYIEEHWDEDFSLEFLAKKCTLSTTHFRHLFKNQYNISPLKYRDSLRLLYAKDLLLQDFYSVSEIAFKCGFTDTNYFCRFFKKNTNLSPAQFRRKTK